MKIGGLCRLLRTLANRVMHMNRAKAVRVWRPSNSTGNQRKEYNLESRFSGFQICPWQNGFTLICYSSCCLPNLRNPAKFSKNSNLKQFKVIQGHQSWCQSEAHICNFLLVINSNVGRVSCRFRNIDTFSSNISRFHHPAFVWRSLAEERSVIST